MFSFFSRLSANPPTGEDNTLLLVLIIAGVVCVGAIAALLIAPKFSKKDKVTSADAQNQSEVEEIHEDE